MHKLHPQPISCSSHGLHSSTKHGKHSDSPPDSSFTRTISNPEAVMRRRRQQTLEAKLMEIVQQGGPDIGGTLKIYGGQICPDVPYKTLLLSANDTVADVIRQSLDKYGLEDADSDAYCLVMRLRTASEVTAGFPGTEKILRDTDCPLNHLFTSSTPEAGTVVTFELRLRPPHLLKKRPFSGSLSGSHWGLSESPSGGPQPTYPAVPTYPTAMSVSSPSGFSGTVFACLVELEPGGFRQTEPGLQEFGKPTGTVYPLPIHKGQVWVGTATNPDASHPLLVSLPIPQWPGVEAFHLVIWRPTVPPGTSSIAAAADGVSKRCGWLACQPCSTLDISTGQNRFAKVYVNNRLLAPSPGNYACTHWLSPGDVLYLGNSSRGLKIWPGSGAVLPGSRSSSVKAIPPALVQPSSSPRSHTHAAPSPVPQIAYPEVPKHQRLYSSDMTVPANSSRMSPRNAECDPNLWNAKASYASPVSFLSPLIQSPRPRVVGSSPKTSFHDSPIYSPTGSVSASSSSLSSNPISDTSSSLPNYTADLMSSRNQIPCKSTAKSVVHTSSPHMPSRQIRDHHAATISNAPTACPAVPAARSSTICTTSPDGLSLSYGYPTVSSGASYQMRFSPPFNPIPECSKPSAYEISPVTAAGRPTKVDSSTSPVHRVSQNLVLAGIDPTDPIRSSSSSSCTPRSGVSAGHSGSGRSKSTPTISDRLPCQMAFAPASVNSLLDWIITDYLSSLGGYPYNRNSQLACPAPDTPPPIGCPLGPAMTVYLMLRAICRQCDRWEMMESKHQLKEVPLKRGPQASNVTDSDNQPAVNSSLAGDSNEMTIRKANLRMRQRSRRQREILSLLVAAVERLQSFETILIDWFGRMGLLSTENEECKTVVEGPEPNFPGVLQSTSAWLANSSQLLHLTTRDADLQKAFSAIESLDDNQSMRNARESYSTEDQAAHSAWLLVHEQLADVVQAAFGCLAELCVSRLDRFGIPQLISAMTKAVESSSRKKTTAGPERSSSPAVQVNGESSDAAVQDIADDEEGGDGLVDWEQLDAAVIDKKDSVISLFSEIMNCLHMAFINPAFVVQLFARLLHRLNARLFNFLIGIADSSETGMSPTTHVSSSWGVVLHRWIHGSICAWALSQGLSMAAECYLQRISQAADLMLADMTSVESLYNVAVDLIGLNSRQIRALLENFRCANSNGVESGPKDSNPVNNRSTHIPQQWIDFVVSGVKEVADRILAEEEASHSAESGANSAEDTAWSPDLAEPLDLLLPFLLPEDSYPSDNPVPLDCCDDPVSCDSGVSSRTSSTKDKDYVQTFENNKDHTDALITVDSLKSFLERAVKVGWCRLSVRPICVPYNADVTRGLDRKPNGINSCPFLTWNVYLSKTTDSQSSPSAEENVRSTAPVDPVSKPKGETDKSEQNDGNDKRLALPQNNSNMKGPDHSSLTITNHSVESPDQKSSESGCSVASSSSTAPLVSPKSPTAAKSDIIPAGYPDFCDKHRPFTVIVPKVGRSLGLNIIAARSEEGKNLGIYIRSVIPGSGASRARLCSAESRPVTNGTQSLLQPGDHLLAVNDHSTFELSYEAASQIVASAGEEVRLTVVRNVAFRSAICGLTGNSASTAVTGSLDTDQPSERSRICPECRLCASLVVKSITLHAGDDGPLVSNCEEHPSSRQQVFLTNLHSLTEEDPPPEPSALGPVMHLPAKVSHHFSFCTRDPTHAPEPTTHFVPLVRPCPLARGEDVVYPLVVDTGIRRPSLPHVPSSSYRFLSPEPVMRTARPLPTQVKRCSSSAGALHRGCDTLPCYSRCRAERHSHEGSSDPGEPTASEYSLGSSTGPSFRLFSPQSLNRVKSHTATLDDWRFRSDDLPSDRPCHRPRGQSSSFDDWVSISQVNILCERLTNGLVSSTDANNRDCGQSNSLRRISSRNDSVEVNAHRSANFTSRTAPRPELSNAKSTEPTSISTSAFSYFVNSSKPPSVFVPTAAFLPSDSSTMMNESSSTDQPESTASWTNGWRCGARASKSLTDLPSLTHKRSVHQSSVSPVTLIVRNRSGRPMQRRHTTLTTSRFNLGPRPEPPSQQSFHHSIATLNLRS
ncbi:unnamed protein product [Calicophoron daubneyi]